MEKYIINTSNFKNKAEISEKCRNIIANNIDKDLSGEDLKFMVEILSFTECKERLYWIKRIFVSTDLKYGKENCFFIENIIGEIQDISWTKCVLNIPFGEEHKIEWNLPFGKYKGESAYDVCVKDRPYIEWLADFTNSRDLKTKLHQLLRFGHIPYNPIAHKHAVTIRENYQENNNKEV